eukprot:Gb_32459 [translate_table: standard]
MESSNSYGGAWVDSIILPCTKA